MLKPAEPDFTVISLPTSLRLPPFKSGIRVTHRFTRPLNCGVPTALSLVAEFSPRVSGYKPGVNRGSFAIEKRAGGHVFQLNFSNAFGTELSQIAQGATSNANWYMGFNLTRKFY
jgi:hypothetical protein